MGRHSSRAQVFADQHGQRTRLITLLLRGTTLVVVAGLAALGISLMAGVSLPGVTPAVRPPVGEQPAQHAERTPSPDADRPTEGPALPLPSAPLGTRPGSATSAPTPSSVTPTPSSPAVPASTPTNPPSTPPRSRSHGNAPVTPPGRTKHP